MNNLIVDEDEIASVVSTWTKIPVSENCTGRIRTSYEA